MGFCIEATGMTQGSQDELHYDLEMEGGLVGSVGEPSVKDEAECMEDDQDPEVSIIYPVELLPSAVVTCRLLNSTFVFDILSYFKQFGPMTVEIKSQKTANLPASDVASKAPDLKDILSVDPLQQGQALHAAGKKRKKQQKRAGLCYSLSYPNTVHPFVCGVLTLCEH